ncbi:hypothetical protein [Zhenpiania hominis]|uniref:hypothetical protein n=1 Tax=Zhenpiania hominis TaxID=2763644 RepID=UPI0039F60806
MDIKRSFIKLIKIMCVASILYLIQSYTNQIDVYSLDYHPLFLQILAFFLHVVYGGLIGIFVFDLNVIKKDDWKNEIPGLVLVFFLACVDILSPWLLWLPGFVNGTSKYFQLILGGWAALLIKNQIIRKD